MKNRVYVIDTDHFIQARLYEKWHSAVPQWRREKADRFRFDKDKRLSLGAGAALEIALRDSGRSTADVTFSEHGKPELNGICFNLSHSGHYAVCAVSDDTVGVDVEVMREFSPKLAKRVFTQQEISQAQQAYPGCDSNRILTRLWTIKESIMKYYGQGISLSPESIVISPASPITAACDAHDTSELHFTLFEVNSHLITVCSQKTDFELCEISADKLI
ncbi:MAG: 4'-phosphopantetheinyl transferase superfamily protein [Ruminococcus sp.]|nr:4'-phosphopantetheinyl transferase superfamily protein [Ruminococcus sp.]